MKIGFQGYFLSKPYTGIGQYSLHLLQAMAKASKKHTFLVVVPEKISVKFPKNVKIKILRPKRARSAGLQKVWWEQMQVSSYFKKQKVDFVHFPYPANPWYRSPFRSVVSVHDTIPWDRKEYRRTVLARLKHRQTKKALKRATKIITVSKATATDLTRHVPKLKKKIEVVHNAPAPIFLKKTDKKAAQRILKNYKLNGKKYFLYVGGYDDRKNVKNLANAYLEQIAPKYDIDLLFVGDKLHISTLYKSLDYLTNFEESTSLRPLKGKIRLTGFVSDEDLCALYSGAFAFLNLSFQEGFNIPLVEAACKQLPVVTSDIPVHREILGDYAVFADPKSKQDIAKKMQKLAGDTAYYKKLKQKCEAYKCPYKWSLSAKNTLKIYESIFGPNHTG